MNQTLEKTKQYRFIEEPDENGKPQHLHQLNKDGEWQNLTGTSSVMDVLGKNLVWWAAELAAVECLESGEKIATIREEYELAVKSGNKKQAIDALQVKYPIFKKARFAHYATKNKKAKEGTDLHFELEKFVKTSMGLRSDKEFDKRTFPFQEWAAKECKRFVASEANCYSEKMWVGGKMDAVAELKDGRLAVIDFKSAKEAFISHFIQCAGYAIQINENGLFDETGSHNKKLDRQIEALIVVPFGAEVVVPEIRTEVKEYQSGFESALNLYRIMGMDKKIKEFIK